MHLIVTQVGDQTNMFPGIERELSRNKFFQAWRESSIFEQLFGTPRILAEEFPEQWIEGLKKVIGEGPMTSRYLANLADYIEKIRGLDGYSRIKERLLRLDDQLHPTLAEIEFIWFLSLKVPPEKIHLEYTFKSPSGKNPELMVDLDSEPVYFEVTSVEDYKQMNLILRYFNTLTAFQLSLKILHNLHRRIAVTFPEYPTEDVFQDIYQTLNKRAKVKSFLFEETNPHYKINVTEGDNVVFDIPAEYLESKIKDKVEEKTAKFKEGERNYIVIDVTPIVTDIKIQLDKVNEYFHYSENKTVWGVLLQSKAWTFEGLEPLYRFQVMCQANSLIEDKKPFRTISKLMPNSTI
jgi:hypothetical protein